MLSKRGHKVIIVCLNEFLAVYGAKKYGDPTDSKVVYKSFLSFYDSPDIDVNTFVIFDE